MAGSDLVTIFQHRAKSGPNRYWLDTNKLSTDPAWGEGASLFGAYLTQVEGTIPVYQHKATGPDRYLYDLRPEAHDGWSAGTVLCYAYPASSHPLPTVPIYVHTATNPYRCYLDGQKDVPWYLGWSPGSLLCYGQPVQRTLIDDVTALLGWQGGGYRGVTYQDTADNTFTPFDTPHLWDATSAEAPQPTDGDKLFLQAIEDTVAGAKRLLDITLLYSPAQEGVVTGGFLTALANGFKRMTPASGMLVRIMIGMPIGTLLSPDELEQYLTSMTGNRSGFTAQIAGCRQATVSWNHAKIVAADGRRAIVGGHNMWAADYLGASPVHDVSGLIEGSIVECAHGFCTALWKKPAPFLQVEHGRNVFYTTVSMTNGKFQLTNSVAEAPALNPTRGSGSTRILSLGRLGDGLVDEFTIATNASVTARLAAFCRAESVIRLSQQSLTFSILGVGGGFDFYTVWALVKAIEAGVEVQIVVSDQTTLSEGGYTGSIKDVLNEFSSFYIADRLGIYKPDFPLPVRATPPEGWADVSLKAGPKWLILPTQEPTAAECKPFLDELNAKLKVAPLYYSSNLNYWLSGGSKLLAANHAKVYIIDETHFYVGSDNCYLSGGAEGLQEYGHLVEDEAATKSFIDSYWNKLWNNSKNYAVPAVNPKWAIDFVQNV